MNKEKFMKNGVFSLEYDKETLKDMVLELQDKIEAYENMRKEAIEYTKSHFKEMVADEEAQILLDILNKVGSDK